MAKVIEIGTGRVWILVFLLQFAAYLHIIPVSVQLALLATAVVYMGSAASVRVARRSAANPSAPRPEIMEKRDTYMFPFIGSAVLLSLYLAFKYIPQEYFNVIVKGYFFFFGTYVVATRTETLLMQFAPRSLVTALQRVVLYLPSCRTSPSSTTVSRKTRSTSTKRGSNKKISIKDIEMPTMNVRSAELLRSGKAIFTMDGVQVCANMVGLATGISYILWNHWAANNAIGIAFAVQGIEMLSPGSFLHASILLTGLFFYDIFWVFGTDVMVTVAKKFDAPIKLLFPQMNPALANPLLLKLGFAAMMVKNDDGEMVEATEIGSPSLLGLGDIVIPGIVVALLLRFDMRNRRVKSSRASSHSGAGLLSLPYFRNTIIGYILGLILTTVIMYAWGHAQPALLYLVPSCLGSAFLTGLVRGEVRQLFAYEELNDDEEDEEEKNEDEKLEAAQTGEAPKSSKHARSGKSKRSSIKRASSTTKKTTTTKKKKTTTTTKKKKKTTAKSTKKKMSTKKRR